MSDRSPAPDADAAPRRSWLVIVFQPKVGVPLALLLVLIAAPLLWRQSRVADIPDIGPPFDLEADGTVALADEDNAAADYRLAGTLVRDLSDTDQDAFDATQEKGWVAATDSLRAWLESNRAALDEWRKGTEKPDFLIQHPKQMQIESPGLPEVAATRALARAASAEAARLESEGRLDDAWRSHRALFRYSRHVGRYGCLIERYIGIAVHSVAIRGLIRWSSHPRATDDMLTEALSALRQDDRLTAPLSRTFKTEYFYLDNTLNRRDLDEHFLPSVTSSVAEHRVRVYLNNEPLLARLATQQYFANLFDHIDKPLPTRPVWRKFGCIGLFDDAPPPSSGRLGGAKLGEAMCRSFVAVNLLPALMEGASAVANERTRQAALVGILAAQVHQRKFGRLSDDLNAVVEAGILDALPIDPMSPSGDPIRYRKDADSFTVYGVGFNGTDDGGDIKVIPGRVPIPDIGFTAPAPAEPSEDERPR